MYIGNVRTYLERQRRIDADAQKAKAEAEAEAEAEAKAERPYSFSHHIYECMYVCALPSFPSLSFLFESLLCPATTTR